MAVLISTVSATVAATSTTTHAHGLKGSSGQGVTPDLVLPLSPTTLEVTTADATNITVQNTGGATDTAIFLCIRFHSMGRAVASGAGLPFMQNLAGGGGVGGRVSWVDVSDAVYVVPASDVHLSVSRTAAGASGLTLPSAAATGVGKVFWVKDSGLNSAVNNITITPDGGDTIDGAPNLVISTNAAMVKLTCDGVSNWEVG
ncbi:MAG: hypothetical protein ABIE42_09265 [Candidatus Eisenbacteria bacterium]